MVVLTTGTAIVAHHTGSDLFVAADSKVSNRAEPNKLPRCKIYPSGRIFFTLAGIAGNEQIGFDLLTMAHGAISAGGTVPEIASRFKRDVWIPLYDLARQIKDDDPTQYEKITGTESVLDIAFFGIEQGEPLFICDSFLPRFSVEEPDFDTCRKQMTPGTRFFMGHRVSPTPPLIQRLSPIDAIAALINRAIDDRPDIVGPPISILRINHAGAAWVLMNDLCPAIS